ncbi:MAG: DNA repair and genetic recombination, partial [uncultured bacterium]
MLVTAIAAERGRLVENAKILSGRRREKAAALKATIEAEIRTLGMENAHFAVVFREIPEGDAAFNEKGIDDPEFYLSTNVGEELKPLRGIAS